MQGAWLMLQQEQAGDYVLASGVGHTVEQLAETAFTHVGLNAHEHMKLDKDLQRAPEQTPRIGDPSRARRELRWQPTLSFQQLIGGMVDADLADLS